MESNIDNEIKRGLFLPAGFKVRLIAYIIDLIVIISIVNLLVAWGPIPANLVTPGIEWLGLGLSLAGITASLYFLLMTRKWRQTIGKMITGIEVIRTDGHPLDFSTLLFREVFGRFISQLGGLHLGYLWVGLHPQKKSWHDSISDTAVIHQKENILKHYIKIN